jgi:hypothetical protein
MRSQYAKPVPADHAALLGLMADGWELHAPFDEPPFMEPPERIAKLLGFDAFVKATEAHAIDAYLAGHTGTTRHGVSTVDLFTIVCLCEAVFFVDRGGWIDFNHHLAEVLAEVGSLEAAWAELEAAQPKDRQLLVTIGLVPVEGRIDMPKGAMVACFASAPKPALLRDLAAKLREGKA